MLLAAASISVALQLNLAIALASLSGDPGAITAYSYAFFGISLMLAVSSFSIGLVTIPGLVDDFARRGMAAASDYYARVPPYAFAVLVPCLVAFAVDGKPVLDAVFALPLGAHDRPALPARARARADGDTGGAVVPGRQRHARARARPALHRRLARVARDPARARAPALVDQPDRGRGRARRHDRDHGDPPTAIHVRGVVDGTTATAIRRSAPAFALAGVIVVLRLPLDRTPARSPRSAPRSPDWWHTRCSRSPCGPA